MLTDSKIRPDHLRRQAVVYVPQSTLQQVRGNRESSTRQYALADRAKALGWPAGAVQTIDDDQGRSGAHADHRHGFKKLLAEIAAGQVGLVLALEASRLARSSLDWHRLVEICVVTDTLLADESAVYNPRDPNDRLLLGVKGTLSKAELFTIRCRLHDGRWNKAKRGELANSLPVGYVRTGTGAVVKEPDRQVQARLAYVFDLFAELKVARRVLVRLRQEKLTVPAKVWGGPRHGAVRWKVPTFSDIMRLLHNPIYAGAYASGQKAYDPFERSPTNSKAKTKSRPVTDWPVCLQNVYPAYISWDQFVRNQQTLRDNWFRHGSRGAPRSGRALLQGIVHCGRCGERMAVFTYSTKEKRAPGYGCVAAYQDGAASTCQMMSLAPVDAAVTELFLAAVTPAQVEIALHALDEYEAEQAEARRQRQTQLEQAEYEVELASRRYEAADPANRLVAGELEARWEQALRHRDQLQRETDELERRTGQPLEAADRARVRQMATDLKTVWQAPTTTMADRKTLLRFLVHRVYLDGVTEVGQIRITVEWHTGARTSVTVPRSPVGAHAPKTPEPAVERIRALWPGHAYATDCQNPQQGRLENGQGIVLRSILRGIRRAESRLESGRFHASQDQSVILCALWKGACKT
jgi:DNA invertase Pin-like site-specific DNA recombinase